jgi:hypothetical protein
MTQIQSRHGWHLSGGGELQLPRGNSGLCRQPDKVSDRVPTGCVEGSEIQMNSGPSLSIFTIEISAECRIEIFNL